MDYFPTPPSAIRPFLAACPLPGGRWLEPSAGDGSIIRTVNSMRSDVVWRAVELRGQMLQRLAASIGDSGTGEVTIGDFLARETWAGGAQTFDVVIGNAPYTLGERFVGAALERAPVVAFLFRLDFLGSVGRAPFWRRHPADVYVLAPRPSFTGGGTEASEFAWFVWGQCGSGPGRIHVLGPPETLPLLAGV